MVLEDARVLAQLLAVFSERDIAVLELHGRDIADLLKLRLKVLSLARREIFVDPDDDLVGLLQVNVMCSGRCLYAMSVTVPVPDSDRRPAMVIAAST